MKVVEEEFEDTKGR